MYNPNLDIINIKAHKTFGENLSFYSQDIVWKRIYDGQTDRQTDGRTNVMNDNTNPI